MIKKIAKEELPEILPIRRKRITAIRFNLEQLAVGEGLFVSKEDWKAKSSPSYLVASIRKSFGYQYEWGLKADGSGWLFRRIK